ncbi:type II 3-dehydroquinate dehydratase [Sinomicrobium sp.]
MIKDNSTKAFIGVRLKQAMLLIVVALFSIGFVSSAEANVQPLRKGPVKILLIQGANMAYLGKREPDHYGNTTAKQLDAMVREHAKEKGYEVEIFYTNHEGEAIDKVYEAVEEGIDGIVMNPGGFTYSGYSLRDCLIAVPVPYVEVHMLPERDWTGEAITSAAADLKIVGMGIKSYFIGLDALVGILSE